MARRRALLAPIFSSPNVLQSTTTRSVHYYYYYYYYTIVYCIRSDNKLSFAIPLAETFPPLNFPTHYSFPGLTPLLTPKRFMHFIITVVMNPACRVRSLYNVYKVYKYTYIASTPIFCTCKMYLCTWYFMEVKL